VAPAICTPDEQRTAAEFRALLAAYRDARDLIEIGAYVPGTNPQVDMAVHRKDAMDGFLRQGMDEVADLHDSWRRLAEALEPSG
jgi:flagellum-specific ATP synthase